MKNFIPRRKLSFSEIVLIPEAFYQLLITRIEVSFLPSKKYLPKVNSLSTIQDNPENRSKARLIAAVINGLSFRTPWPSTCLVKVLATHRILQNRRIGHKLHFGVSKSNGKGLEAHAWLSVDNEVIVGGENHENFNEITGFR